MNENICAIFTYLAVCTLAPVHRYLQRPEEDIGLPGAQVVGGWELPSVAAGNLTQVPVAEEQVHLTAKPSFQTPNMLTFNLLRVIHS